MHSSHHSCMWGENPGTSQVWGNHLIGMRKIKWHNREKTIWKKKLCRDKKNTGTHTCRPLIYTQGDKKSHNNLKKAKLAPLYKNGHSSLRGITLPIHTAKSLPSTTWYGGLHRSQHNVICCCMEDTHETSCWSSRTAGVMITCTHMFAWCLCNGKAPLLGVGGVMCSWTRAWPPLRSRQGTVSWLQMVYFWFLLSLAS